eukprot:m.115439 g.115439  ORF g.115439 m.115439 type:complete len:717 (-) comp13566_c0_seq1:279-2429(-)
MADAPFNVAEWLATLKLEQYAELFQANGITTEEQVAALSSEVLDELDITLQGHRNRILKHRPNVSVPLAASEGEAQPVQPPVPAPRKRAQPPPPSVATEQGVAVPAEEPAASPSVAEAEDDFGLDSLLSGLNSMIGDLDLLASGESELASSDGPEPSGLSQAASQARTLVSMETTELDDILGDLCAFSDGITIERQPTIVEEVIVMDVAPEDIQEPATEQAIEPEGDAAATEEASQDGAQVQMRASVHKHLEDLSKRVSAQGQLSRNDLDAMMKEEKVRIAMAKLAEAQNQKVVVKIELNSNASNTFCITTSETAFHVCRKVLVKNRIDDSPYWHLVESCPDLAIQRPIEDHESIGEIFLSWSLSSTNKFCLFSDSQRFDLFLNPEKYFPRMFRDDLEQSTMLSEQVGKAKRAIFQEFFSTTQRIPEVKGYASVREGKKWKKRYLILRASGIYYSTKGESEASKDLAALAKFDELQLFFGSTEFQAKTKAPSPFIVVFRPNLRKRDFTLNDLIAFAFPTEEDMHIWTAGCRLAIYGNIIKENFNETCRKFEALAELGEFDKDLAREMTSRKDQLTQQKFNPQLVHRWQAQRASKRTPMVSAATGVEFGDVGESLESQPWFHGSISRQQSESYLSKLGNATGAFLIRSSVSRPGDYVLTLGYENAPRHFHIKKSQTEHGTRFVFEHNVYDTLMDLVKTLQGDQKTLPTKLLLAIPKQ